VARTVAITGAGSGIGRAVARAFAENGDEVVICDISPVRLDETLSLVGSGARGSVVDVSNFAALSTFLHDVGEADGLDVIVNNAGVFDGYAGIDETSAELWRRVIDINLTGCFYGCKIAAALMTSRGRGRIVNIGSIASFRGRADGLAYTASKAAILGLTRRLAFDVGRYGITANVICPGTISTDIRSNSQEILGEDRVEMNRGVGVGLSQELLDFLIPARRKGTSDEVAALAVFLASPGASYINGEAIAVDGGWLAV
jgi:NAD(P)-dependent dehydrogenase (short-subunit alcohol dehydrogenase family)